jgi:hypothetical protein
MKRRLYPWCIMWSKFCSFLLYFWPAYLRGARYNRRLLLASYPAARLRKSRIQYIHRPFKKIHAYGRRWDKIERGPMLVRMHAWGARPNHSHGNGTKGGSACSIPHSDGEENKARPHSAIVMVYILAISINFSPALSTWKELSVWLQVTEWSRANVLQGPWLRVQ